MVVIDKYEYVVTNIYVKIGTWYFKKKLQKYVFKWWWFVKIVERDDIFMPDV